MDLTHEQVTLIRQKHMDVRCDDCGAGSAFSRRCYACGSQALVLVPHGSPGWTHCLGGSGGSTSQKGTRWTEDRRARQLAARVGSQTA